MTDNGKIGSAILGVMSEVGYVQKERAAGLNYSFASEAALIEALRPAMLKWGVFASVMGLTEIARDGFVTKSGTAMNRTFVHGVVRFTHPGSETYIDVHAMGEGMDAGDKSANKAATSLLKYALRQTFLIETGDDPDRDSSGGQERLTSGKKTPEQVPEPKPTSQSIEHKAVAQAPSKATPKPPARLPTWPATYVKELVAQEIAENPQHAMSILVLSPFETKEPLGNVVRWAKIYRARRDDGMETDMAADTANDEYRNSQ